MKLALFHSLITIFMLKIERTRRTLWNNQLGNRDMLNLYPQSSGVASSINMSVVLISSDTDSLGMYKYLDTTTSHFPTTHWPSPTQNPGPACYFFRP